MLLSRRSKERWMQKIRELTPRNWGDRLSGASSVSTCTCADGWVSSRICTAGAEWSLRYRDAHLRAAAPRDSAHALEDQADDCSQTDSTGNDENCVAMRL